MECPWLSNRCKMRFLAAALALLLVGVANAIPDIQLSYPVFVKGETFVYDVWINLTSGIPGMHPQVSKSAMKMDLKVYGKTQEEAYVLMDNVMVSKSVARVGSPIDPMEMHTNNELQELLKRPIKVYFENGKVTKYTLDNQESVESKKIKKTLLRHLELHLDQKSLKPTGQLNLPRTYNRTVSTPFGNYSSHYIVTTSPYPDFPMHTNVFNITRTDNQEVIPYLAYHIHHNFEEQGCPGVCKKNQVENRFSAGCPAEYEPYHTPMKRSFVRHHNLRKLGDKLAIDIVETKETHVADIYDQNMEVIIQSLIRLKLKNHNEIPEPTGQKTYTNLNDWRVEVDEKEIDDYCKMVRPEEAIRTVKELLNQITQIAIKGNIDEHSKNFGEKLVLLQKAFSLLRLQDLVEVQKEIIPFEKIIDATDEEKIKRQLYLDFLPLIGSSESISYIVDLIKNDINRKHKEFLSLWESKNILEDLPMNIYAPNSRTIQRLSELLEALKERSTTGFGMYYSASHIAVARVIRNLCAVNNGTSEADEGRRQNYLQMLLKESDDDYKNLGCPKTEAKRFITDVAQKLKGNTDRLKRIIYIETLTQTGLKSAIPVVKPYVQGYGIVDETPSYVDYVRSVAINALHNLVDNHPKEIKDIVLPIFTNKTEPPKIRTAAFSVFARSYPTLGDLQHVAEESWHEPSKEVGSYVFSTLETFGNSSIPCDQLTASRIKKVLPQVKRFPVGKQRAQNILTTLFDDIRGLGIEHRFEFTPSNESFIPSSVYAALGYNADSLRDYYFKHAIVSQGFSSFNTWDKVLREIFHVKPAENIPKEKESQIFPEVQMADRAAEFWRFTFFQKLFYSSSYYYMDDQEYQRGDILALLKRHVQNYFKWEGNGNIRGHLVKVWLPSSYQSKSFAQSLPYPVQFEMKNPVLLSLKVDMKRKENGYSADVQPSFYHSMLYSNGMLNLGDCKHIGVYHEKKLAATYPIKLTFRMEKDKYDFSYSFPELPKKIFTYHSEAGTYATKHSYEVYPSRTEKREIKTIPSQFMRNSTFGVVGLPLFSRNVLTEEITLGYDQMPRNAEEGMYQITKDFLNPGWRRKSIDIFLQPDNLFWQPNTEVKMHITRQHSFIPSKLRPEEFSKLDWMKHLNIDEDNENNIISDENKAHRQIQQLSHLLDLFSISVEQKISERVVNKVNVQVAHTHALDGVSHHVQVNATCKVRGLSLRANSSFLAVFYGVPNEFKYGDVGYGKQLGFILGSIRVPQSPNVYVRAKLSNELLTEHLKKEMQPQLPSKYFYPETHDECLEDVQKEKVHSVACLKAIRERAIFNRMSLKFILGQDPHDISVRHMVEEILAKVDLAVKHAFFNHLSVQKNYPQRRNLRIDLTYVDKMTDKPVVDVVVRKPSETLKFHKVDPGFIQPMSSIYSMQETYLQYHTNITYPATCTLMKDSVRTYDLKTIRLLSSNTEACSYILSTHCVQHKKFAVIAKIDPKNPKSREIHLYIGTHSVTLTPGKEWEYVIHYDNKPYTVRYPSAVMLQETEKIYAVTKRYTGGPTIIEIHAEKAGIKVTYDGQHVKTQVHPRYKGELCGLCSEFDGEVVRELRGPDRCLYSNVYDFANSCGLGSCHVSRPVSKYICDTPKESVPNSDKDEIDEVSAQNEYEPKVKRNEVRIKGDTICFSTRPIPVCKSQDVPKETETEDVEFHCLPRNANIAKKLERESKRRSLGELETKKGDIVENIEYPTLCARH